MVMGHLLMDQPGPSRRARDGRSGGAVGRVCACARRPGAPHGALAGGREMLSAARGALSMTREGEWRVLLQSWVPPC